MTHGPCGCLASSSRCGLVAPSSHTLLAVGVEAQQKQRRPDKSRVVIRYPPWHIVKLFELITNTVRPPIRNGPRKVPRHEEEQARGVETSNEPRQAVTRSVCQAT